MIAGFAMGLLFVRRQRRIDNPLVDLALFRSRAFSTALAVMLVGGVVMAGVSFLSSQWLQLVAGLDPLGAGLWMLPRTSRCSSARRRRRGSPGDSARRAPWPPGSSSAPRVSSLYTQVGAAGGLGLLVFGMCLTSFGIMLPSTLTMSVMMQSAPPERAGSVASMSETSGEFGIAVGIAGLGSLATFVYRDHLGAVCRRPPLGVPAPWPSTPSPARSGRPSPCRCEAGHDLVAAAQDAFTTSLNVVAGVGAGLFVVVAVATLRVLRTR